MRIMINKIVLSLQSIFASILTDNTILRNYFAIQKKYGKEHI